MRATARTESVAGTFVAALLVWLIVAVLGALIGGWALQHLVGLARDLLDPPTMGEYLLGINPKRTLPAYWDCVLLVFLGRVVAHAVLPNGKAKSA